MTVRIVASPKILLRSRSVVLHDVADDFARSLGASEASLNTIRKGVLERQLISDIILCYLRRDTLVGRILITIDWDKHQVLAQAEEGKEFSIDPTKSIPGQISEIFPILADHAAQLRRSQKIDRVVTWYRYRRDIREDPAKLQEARRFLDLLPDNMPEWAKGISFPVKLETTAKKLAELGIKIEHQK